MAFSALTKRLLRRDGLSSRSLAALEGDVGGAPGVIDFDTPNGSGPHATPWSYQLPLSPGDGESMQPGDVDEIVWWENTHGRPALVQAFPGAGLADGDQVQVGVAPSREVWWNGNDGFQSPFSVVVGSTPARAGAQVLVPPGWGVGVYAFNGENLNAALVSLIVLVP